TNCFTACSSSGVSDVPSSVSSPLTPCARPSRPISTKAMAAGLISNLQARSAVLARGGRAERKPERACRPTLLADHVPEIVLVDAQLERRVVPGLEDLDVDLIGMVDDALGHVDDQVTELEVDVVGLARRQPNVRLRRA